MEIEKLIIQYRINEVVFRDDLFFSDRKRLLKFLDLLEERKIEISWTTTIHANCFKENYLNLELLKRIRRLGGFHFGLGAESGSERILQKINKRISKKDIIRAAKWSKESNINIGFSFMIGLPGESEKEMKKTIKFAFDIVNLNPQNSFIYGPSVFKPYPGSALFKECVKEYKLQVPQLLEDWDKVYGVEDGYLKLEKLPWVDKPYLVRALIFYLMQGTRNFVYQGLWIHFANIFLKSLCRFRLKVNFFYFPFEYKCWLRYKSLQIRNKHSGFKF